MEWGDGEIRDSRKGPKTKKTQLATTKLFDTTLA